MKKKVIIIGAGISGLCAGSYLQMNGYDTEIFEMHNISGGMCSAWKRNGYTIDGCIHWLVGASPRNNFYKLWSELIDLEKMQFAHHEIFLREEDLNGNYIDIYSDVEKLREELLTKAPEDKENILEFTSAIKKFSSFNLPIEKPIELMNLADKIKVALNILPYYFELKKWMRTTGWEYAKKFKNPILSHAIATLYDKDTSFIFQILNLSWFYEKSAKYPIGGSLAFAQTIEKAYLERGGKINYRAKVKKIITEKANKGDEARGILLDNGLIHHSDYVISSADAHHTTFNLLDAKYVNQKLWNDPKFKANFSILQISIGVNCKLDHEPEHVTIPFPEPIVIDPMTKSDHMVLRIFNFDPSMSPVGKTIITALTDCSNHEYWVDLRKTKPEAYQKEKDRIANAVIDVFDKRFKGIKEKIEMVDVTTPATYIRYTNDWKGSFTGWILSPETGWANIKKTLPGLSNFYQVGQWAELGGGLPNCLLSARNVTQMICKQDKKKFINQTHTK